MEEISSLQSATPSSSIGGEPLPSLSPEGRREPRTVCEGFAEVAVIHPETLFRGRIRDISLHGCFVESLAHVHLELNAQADLLFNLRNRHYKAQAEVMNIHPGSGVGFAFRFADVEQAERIRDLLAEVEA